jgi:hypothetical protein
VIAVCCIVSSINEASICQEEDNMMPCISTLVRTLGVMTLVGMASLSLPFPAQAGGVHVSIGVGLPVVVAPAPVIVQPAPVVVVQPAPVMIPQPVVVQRAPVIVTEPPVVVAEPQVVYGYPAYRGPYRYWKHHHHHDD